MATYQFYKEQKIPASINEVWNFISSPHNLSRITPTTMGFKITSKNLPAQMYPGMIIMYKVKPMLNLPITWVTEITQVQPQQYFVDEQRQGPYKMWHHEHWIKPIDGGVIMQDLISYTPPFGLLGRLANAFVIKKKLRQIFNYRKQALVNIFGQFN